MRLVRNARLFCAALALTLVGACGGDSNDPTPFDPAALNDDFDAAESSFEAIFDGQVGLGYLLAAEAAQDITDGGPIVVRQALESAILNSRSGAARDSLVVAARALLGSHVAVSGSAVILPAEVLGSTLEWEGGGYVFTERTGAPANGIRFILYAVDPVTEQPAEPLNEVGYLDIIDLSTATADIMRLLIVSGGTTYFDYRVTATGTETNGGLDVVGFIGDGTHRISFDLGTDFASSEVSSSFDADWELEFEDVDLTLAYLIGSVENASGSTGDWQASLRGPHGYVDMTGTTSQTDTGWSEEFLFEVNGDDFAVYSCNDQMELCDITDPDGGPLTPAEVEALDQFWGFAEAGAVISMYLIAPAAGLIAF